MATDGTQSLPPVRVGDGTFVRDGEPFTPRGFNYIRLREREDHLWHDTFNPATYDPERAGAMFEDLGEAGFSVVRVFLDPETGAGLSGDPDVNALSTPYLENLADFIGRAADAGLYIIPTFASELPAPDRYRELAGDSPEWAGGKNRQYFDPGFIEAMAAYRRDVIEWLAEADAAPLDAVLAVELENESCYVADAPPFAASGEVTVPYLGTYDVGTTEGAIALADDAAREWARTHAAAIHEVVPETPVSADVFTYRAVGRNGPEDIGDGHQDARFPLRPLALASVDELDYLDLHYYPHFGDLDANLASVEYDRFHEACERAGKPILLGEFSAEKEEFGLEEAADYVSALWADLRERGFDGYCYWTYDQNGQDWLWMATEGDRSVLKALADAG